MKAIKLVLIMFFIFSVKAFSQNPIIENINFCAGSITSVNVPVTNPSLTSTYTWQVKTPTVDWTTITNANAGVIYKDYTTSVLNITRSNSLPVTLTRYRVIENNGSGNLTSNEAVLTVNPLSVAKTITGATPICIGGDETLVYGSGSVGVIQWQSSTTSPISDFKDIDFENGTSYKATNLQNTTWYRVMNTSGVCSSVYSAVVQVIVNTLSIAGDIAGGNINVCKSLNSTDLILYNYEGNIAWQKSSNIDGPYTSINFATSSTYKASSLISNTYFRVLVTNGACPSAITIPVYINTDPTSVSKSIVGAKILCVGSDITLSYESGSVGDIQWQSSTTSSNADDFIDIDASNGLIYTEKDLQETTWYRVINTSGECSPSYSPVVEVVVNQLAEAGFIDGGGVNVCYSVNSTLLNLYNSVGNIQWQKASDVSGLPGTFTNVFSLVDKYTASSLTATTYFRTILTSGVCPTVITDYVPIFVDPLPIVKSISGATPTCIGGSKVLVYGSESLGDIQWQSSTTSGSTGFDDIPAENAEIYLAEDIQETTWYRVSNTNGVCNPMYSPFVRVDVNPPPVSGFIEVGNTIVSKNSSSTELILKNYRGDIQWQQANSLDDTFIDISSSNLPMYLASGLTDTTYFRTIVSNSCSKVVSDPIKIDFEKEFKVNMYPNPFKQEFNIDLIPSSQDPIELKVYDLLGRTLESQKIESSEINSTKFGSSYLPGFYNILIKQGQQEKMIKVIKK